MPTRKDLYGIAEMRRRLGKGEIPLDRIVAYYREKEPEISRTTVRWRLTVMRGARVVTSVARGAYRLEGGRDFRPRSTPALRVVDAIVCGVLERVDGESGERHCLWTTTWIRRFAGRQSIPLLLVVQVPRETVGAVSDALRAAGVEALVEPVVGGSPIRRTGAVPLPKLEKLLVDAYCLFVRDEGETAGVSEGRGRAVAEGVAEAIVVAAHTVGVNRSTALRYARNRGVREEMERLLDAAEAKGSREPGAALRRAEGGTT
jgi:hypothetical protein